MDYDTIRAVSEPFYRRLLAEWQRYGAALDAILALQPDWIGGPRATLDRAQDEARKAREGTGQ